MAEKLMRITIEVRHNYAGRFNRDMFNSYAMEKAKLLFDVAPNQVAYVATEEIDTNTYRNVFEP